jgi:N-terminal domain of (some) glycogen debranching enzymes
MRMVTPHWLDRPEHQWLVRLRPRANLLYCGQGRTVFTTGLDGMASRGAEGLFAYQTRVLSRYRYLIDGEPPEAIAWNAPGTPDQQSLPPSLQALTSHYNFGIRLALTRMPESRRARGRP